MTVGVYSKSEMQRFVDYVCESLSLKTRVTKRPNVGIWRIECLQNNLIAGEWALQDSVRGVTFVTLMPAESTTFYVCLLRIILKYDVVVCIGNERVNEHCMFAHFVKKFKALWSIYSNVGTAHGTPVKQQAAAEKSVANSGISLKDGESTTVSNMSEQSKSSKSSKSSDVLSSVTSASTVGKETRVSSSPTEKNTIKPSLGEKPANPPVQPPPVQPPPVEPPPVQPATQETNQIQNVPRSAYDASSNISLSLPGNMSSHTDASDVGNDASEETALSAKLYIATPKPGVPSESPPSPTPFQPIVSIAPAEDRANCTHCLQVPSTQPVMPQIIFNNNSGRGETSMLDIGESLKKSSDAVNVQGQTTVEEASSESVRQSSHQNPAVLAQSTACAEDVLNKRVLTMLRQFHKGLSSFVMNSTV